MHTDEHLMTQPPVELNLAQSMHETYQESLQALKGYLITIARETIFFFNIIDYLQHKLIYPP